jgi:hypothetical protein
MAEGEHRLKQLQSQGGALPKEEVDAEETQIVSRWNHIPFSKLGETIRVPRGKERLEFTVLAFYQLEAPLRQGSMRGGLETRAVKVLPRVAEYNTPQMMDAARQSVPYNERE